MRTKFVWDRYFVKDLFDSNTAMIPLALGAITVLLGWGIISSFMMGLGFIAMGFGATVAVSRLVTDYERLVLQSVQREKQAQAAKEEIKLQILAKNLKNFPNKEIRVHLKELKGIKKSFEEAIEQEDISTFIDMNFRDRFNELFQKSIGMIEKSSRLHKTASNMSAGKEAIFTAMDKIVDEVGENIITLTKSFEGLTVLALSRDEKGLDDLRQDLESKLSVASELENEMNGMGNTVIDNNIKGYLNID